MALRTLYAQEMIRHGILMPWVAVSQSHGDTELALTLDAADKALAVFKLALDSRVENFLLGSVIKPVFRSHN
jgi:glutamate-1-semialdehyde 2,1-aminomutase